MTGEAEVDGKRLDAFLSASRERGSQEKSLFEEFAARIRRAEFAASIRRAENSQAKAGRNDQGGDTQQQPQSNI